ncbi:PadR family transcriptional regulator [Microbacterium aquimaris]|uniref:PadR family transcriptional regulator n=1 Tax=Microbacterium aquimaris TaxID=459816 RepID=A0ABU5N903_9MICO|nr:PadR family transcriptional regulator [Microbacterium aquimaris]MDZ8162534.1 PadR family transcriptional regulator [Microbacterium aquimaris]
MTTSFSSGPFGSGRGFGAAGGGLFDAMDQLREAFEQRFPARMARGDVRSAVLSLLQEKPMHGYQIIAEIGERSGGMWKPSPGSVYPTLQMLADEGLIVAEESGGRKTYSLTEVGRAEAESRTEGSAPWEMPGMKDAARAATLPKAGVKLAQAAAQVAQHGTAEQVAEAEDVLDDARRKLYSILAQD